VDETDGLRITFNSGEVVHLRASGNAPELRCYNEADSAERVAAMNRRCMEILTAAGALALRWYVSTISESNIYLS
jgi:phosphomannomutase